MSEMRDFDDVEIIGMLRNYVNKRIGESGGGSGGSYDDTEIKQDIADIWKAQGELGAKNLLVYPYDGGKSNTINGITFTVNDDGSIVVNGTSTTYAVYFITRSIGALKHGSYILSNSELLPQGVVLQLGYYVNNAFTQKTVVNNQRKEALAEVTSEFDEKESSVRIVVDPNTAIDNLTIYPMIRYASDTDDTWQPYAATNKELTDKQNALAPIIGEYLPIASNSTKIKRVCEAGASTAYFYVGAFLSKYGLTTSDINLDVSAETVSGNVVTYNNISVNGSNGLVTITFDTLSEAATFICKCSKIQ